MATSLLNKFVDAEQWDAEDIAGRLGMILHAAFLFAGFQPYGAQPRPGHLLLKMQSRNKRGGGSLWLSRLYTAPDLAHRERADAAVLMLYVQGRDVVLLIFLTTTDVRPPAEKRYMERLDLETMRPLLSRSLGAVEPRASRICRSLADGVCWGFLDELCRRNGLPLTGFTSLPDDLKAAILKKLTSGMDLERVSRVCSQLRLLVAERQRDHELWKASYKALLRARRRRPYCWRWRHWLSLGPVADESSDEEETTTTLSVGSSGKGKHVKAFRGLRGLLLRQLSWHLDSRRMIRRLLFRRHLLSMLSMDYWIWTLQNHPPSKEEEEVSTRDQRSGSHHRKLSRNDCKKWHGGGAIHSPSSRYRWKHR